MRIDSVATFILLSPAWLRRPLFPRMPAGKGDVTYPPLPLHRPDCSFALKTFDLTGHLPVWLPLKTKHFLALFGRKAYLPNVERRRHSFASALSLQTLQLVHRAIELLVQVSFVAQELIEIKALIGFVPAKWLLLKVFRPEVKIPIDRTLQIAARTCKVARSEFVRCRLSHMRSF